MLSISFGILVLLFSWAGYYGTKFGAIIMVCIAGDFLLALLFIGLKLGKDDRKEKEQKGGSQ